MISVLFLRLCNSKATLPDEAEMVAFATISGGSPYVLTLQEHTRFSFRLWPHGMSS